MEPSNGKPGSDSRTSEFHASRPGIKFVLCILAVVIGLIAYVIFI
ncbi:MAG TPA: hypothetical protein VGC25_08735 [Alphaproteobacteria bacterium]|jgi:hypothetical protein